MASPTDDMTYAGRADEPMGEFWSWAKFGAAESCTEMSSAAHVYGKRILGAEAFTATDAEKWLGHPALVKDLGDWAFCEGINRFVFHRYALQPWTNPNRAPGISMGPWGLHYERTQTWWEQSRAWHEYLARCQFMLQQGLVVADLCFLAPERSPQHFISPVKSGHDRPGYNFDGCPPEVVLERMTVKDGRIVLPDGMNYRMLVLPQVETMTPRLLRKIKDLVADGATVVGAPPVGSPSLSGYPKCDAEVNALAAELWGTGDAPVELTERPYGKGRVFWGGEFRRNDASPEETQTHLNAAQWIWRREGNPVVAVAPGARYFRRAFVLEPDTPVLSARLVMTADNSFECWVNEKSAGAGDTFTRVYPLNIAPLLKPGTNVIAVVAVNATDNPNPAGLIGSLTIKYSDGQTLVLPTDQTWQAAENAPANWQIDPATTTGWTPAMELGPLGMAPWGDVASLAAFDPIPDINILCRLLAKLGVPPDFSSTTRDSMDSLRYIHKTIGNTDVYFVANKNPHDEEAVCSFRVNGKRPELWWPNSGRIERIAVYDTANGITRVPIHFDPSGSVFVVFPGDSKTQSDRLLSVTRNGDALLDVRAATPPGSEAIELLRDASGVVRASVSQPGEYVFNSADGESRRVTVDAVPDPVRISGPWQVRFPPGWGAPDQVTFPTLISWSEHSDPGVKYFSGTATYSKTFNLPGSLLSPDRRLFLDLGQVDVMAEVKLNGKDLGILWKPPFRVEVTRVCKPGENALEVKVVNLWINRMIGDEQLPEDSDRNPNGTLKSWPEWIQAGKASPTGRYTFTTWRLWKNNSSLQPSGLLGPVRIQAEEVRVLRKQ